MSKIKKSYFKFRFPFLKNSNSQEWRNIYDPFYFSSLQLHILTMRPSGARINRCQTKLMAQYTKHIKQLTLYSLVLRQCCSGCQEKKELLPWVEHTCTHPISWPWPWPYFPGRSTFCKREVLHAPFPMEWRKPGPPRTKLSLSLHDGSWPWSQSGKNSGHLLAEQYCEFHCFPKPSELTYLCQSGVSS